MAKHFRSNYLVFSLVLVGFYFLPFTAFADYSSSKGLLSKKSIFSVPPGLESQVEFWKKIYSRYSTDFALIHDSDNLDIIYEVVYFGDSRLSRRARERKLQRIKGKYRRILRKLARKKNHALLTGEEKRVYDMVRNGFYRASRNIRTQIGQKDRFRQGLIWSGKYMKDIKRILADHGLPQELSVLPHVESSFNEKAYSSAGAAGIWQFTRSTGRLFMRVRYDIDERRDPILSTHAAAKLLKRNYEELQSWPLAITAYNHGTQGMKRAKRRFGDDIVKIIKKYKSRTFGFASQNFYAEFLAALHVVQNEEQYFPDLVKEKPKKWVTIRFDDYLHIDSVARHFNMSRQEIAKANPALRSPVIEGQRRIPRGFLFKASAERYDDLEPLYQKISKAERFDSQVRSKWYTVRRGDTLSGIALRFGVSVRQLKQLNNIGRRNRIYVGRVIRLPERKTRRSRSYQLAKKPAIPSSNSVAKVARVNGDGAYRVRKHDNLTKIAQRFNMRVQDLARINKIHDPDSLFPGQTLKIAEAVATAPNSSSPKLKLPKEKSAPIEKTLLVSKDAETTASTEKQDRVLAVNDKNALKPGVEVKLVSNPSKSFKPNANRPAFMPVNFLSNQHKEDRVGEITVDFDETLSHYAEWAQLSVRELRRINHLRRRSSIPIHSKILVPFTRTDPEKFEERRQEYHKAIQDDFFSNYKVSKLVVRSVKKGETLWEICNDMYFIPFWLLSSYNPEKDINSLSVGEPLVIPLITPIKSRDS